MNIFEDFLEDKKILQIKSLVSRIIVIQKEDLLINEIQIDNEKDFKIMTNKMTISCTYSDFQNIKNHLKS